MIKRFIPRRVKFGLRGFLGIMLSVMITTNTEERIDPQLEGL